MRKTIVTALVTLLVILAVSCDNGLGTDKTVDKTEYTADGQRFVTLKVGGTVGRSLTDANAKGARNFVEVIFRREFPAGSYTYYRTSGFYGEQLSIKVPKVKYEVTDAVILIGKKDGTEYTLLAVGKLGSALDLPASVPSSIIFTVSSLTANLSAEAASPAFAITNSTDFWGVSASVISKQGKYMDTQPSFQVPKQAGITASLTISDFPSSGPVLAPAASPAPAAKISLITNSSTTIPATPDSPTPVTVSGTTCTFDFSFDTSSATEGTYIITFSIPVAFGTDGDGLGWVIRGGTIKDVADPSGTNQAEGVLLTVSTAAYVESVYLPIGTPTW